MSKKTMYILISAAIALAAIVLFFPDNKPADVPASAPVDASSASRRIDYFASHGWEVEEIAEKNITIPADFSQDYEQYAQLQDKQGLPLREYAGRNAQLYVYDVKNYSPESRKMLAELLVCDDTAIASMVYSEDGGSLRLAVS
ncbi:protein of unknown function [Ruminococcus sp. YRD2003]|uniref:DUF4830 domain-containing protein n=1 Tax=Ruminococcus sp. YRD2003 TaxID=1452313 RepID=UPI0008AD6719|nr:protein of unknown function [Ruminococcus flavefaciens]